MFQFNKISNYFFLTTFELHNLQFFRKYLHVYFVFFSSFNCRALNYYKLFIYILKYRLKLVYTE